MPPIGRVYELSPCGLFILTVHTNARASQPLNVTTKRLLMTFPHIIKANLPLLTVPIKTGASFAAFVRCDLFVFHLISGIFSSHDQYRTYPAFPMLGRFCIDPRNDLPHRQAHHENIKDPT